MATDGKLHVAVFPWLAFGHIIPFLEISKLIAHKGHRVSFLSTHRNILRLPKLPPNLITLVPLSLPPVHGLPNNAEASIDVTLDEAQYLKKAFDGLEPELTRFLKNSSPDWIIYDFAPYWLPPVAASLGISRAFFSIFPAWFIVSIASSPEAMIDGSNSRTKPEDYTVPPEWVPFPTKVVYRLHEVKRLFASSKDNTSGVTDEYRCGSVIIGSDAILMRHCMEFEPDWINLLENIHRRPVIPMGLLPPSVQDRGDDTNETWITLENWLNTQNTGSVLYVALGSELNLTRDELTELALGLELARVPFFWALRKPPGSNESDSVELPNGFVERTKERGLVWTSWAPQLKILSHDSVGGFLTHCGWSSIIESLMFGHPLISLPFSLDQGVNSRVVVDKKVAIEVARNEEDGSFTKNSVADSVRLIMVEDEGASYREKAKEMSTMFGDHALHNGYMDNCIQHLQNLRSLIP